MAIVPTTVAKFRATTTAPTAEGYLMLDAGGEPSYWEAADKGSADLDNGGTFLRNKKGFGLRRRYEGARKAIWYGMKPGTDVSDRWQRYINDLVPEQYETVLIWEHGMHEATGIDLGRTALATVCLSGMASFRGKRIIRWNDGQGKIVQFSRTGWVGTGKIEYGSDVDDNDPRLMQNALLYGNGVVRCDNVSRVWESAGHGMVLEGWELAGRPLTNVSGSVVMGQNAFSRCSGQGLYVVGNNANMVTSFANDFRDNAGGSRDASQVGGFSAANLYHLNLVKGNNQMDGAGSIGAVIGNYHEETYSGRGNSYAGQTFVREASNRCGEPSIGQYVDYRDNNHPFNWRQDESGAYGFYPKDGSDALQRYGRAGTNPERPISDSWYDQKSLLIAGKAASQPVESIEAATKLDRFFQRGDTVQPKLEGVAHTCVRGGNGGRPLTGIMATVTPNSGGNLVLEGDISQIQPGMVVEFQGFAVQIDEVVYDINSGQRATGPYQLDLNKYPGLSKPAPVSFPAPRFEPQFNPQA